MSDPSMVCNGHKENSLQKCAAATNAIATNEVFGKSNSESAHTTSEDPTAKDSMTIGTIPFPDFDHMYASSVEEAGGHNNSVNMSVIRSNLNSFHLNLIEDQAKTIEAQSQEIVKLKKQNESLIARIERMNRRLNLNQCNRRSVPRETKIFRRQVPSRDDDKSDVKRTDSSSRHTSDSFPDDAPLSALTPHNSTCGAYSPFNAVKEEPMDTELPSQCEEKPKLCIKFRRNNVAFDELHQNIAKRGKMVRFVEETSSTQQQQETSMQSKRNSAKTAVDEKLVSGDEVLFLKTVADQSNKKSSEENNVNRADSDDGICAKKRKSYRIPILTTSEPYYMAPKTNAYNGQDPVTYTPTALEVPSFRVVDKDAVEAEDVPRNYYEDVTIEAAKERHSRFEIGERKRKKWDVQRIRELRQNERLKEKLRRRKSRWNKLESPKQSNTETPEMIMSLFPDIKCIEKIIITDCVPVTAFGTCVPKISSWGTSFKTEWTNDGTVDPKIFEDAQPTSQYQPHHKDTKNKPT